MEYRLDGKKSPFIVMKYKKYVSKVNLSLRTLVYYGEPYHK